MKNLKIVITGALGFVGVNLALSYLKDGHEVIGLDNKFKSLGSSENLQLFKNNNGIFKYVDIRNSNDIEFFFKVNKNIDVVFNLAAQVAFKNSIENPRLDFEINALGTINLLESIRLYSKNSIFIHDHDSNSSVVKYLFKPRGQLGLSFHVGFFLGLFWF